MAHRALFLSLSSCLEQAALGFTDLGEAIDLRGLAKKYDLVHGPRLPRRLTLSFPQPLWSYSGVPGSSSALRDISVLKLDPKMTLGIAGLLAGERS